MVLAFVIVFLNRKEFYLEIFSKLLTINYFYDLRNISGLMHSWDFNGSLADSVVGLTLKNETNASYVNLGPCLRCLHLKLGYLSALSGVYFSGAFTVTVWVQVKSKEIGQGY